MIAYSAVTVVINLNVSRIIEGAEGIVKEKRCGFAVSQNARNVVHALARFKSGGVFGI